MAKILIVSDKPVADSTIVIDSLYKNVLEKEHNVICVYPQDYNTENPDLSQYFNDFKPDIVLLSTIGTRKSAADRYRVHIHLKKFDVPMVISDFDFVNKYPFDNEENELYFNVFGNSNYIQKAMECIKKALDMKHGQKNA